MDEIKKEILKLIEKANSLIPNDRLPNSEPLDGFPDVPKWHDYELNVWSIGEQVRQKINSKPNLRSDRELQEKIIAIAKNKNAKRGRQSFIMLLAYKSCASCSYSLLPELDDPDVGGHVIYAWRKMQVSTFTKYVSPHLNSQVKWIKDEAKKYINKFNQT